MEVLYLYIIYIYIYNFFYRADNPHKLKDVFICLTSCSEVPPLGFQEAVPKIYFSPTVQLHPD